MSEGNAISKQVGGNNPRVDQSEFSSRLDRLLSLLENASSPVTRAEAARQLGEVQQKYPTELNALLSLGLKSCTLHRAHKNDDFMIFNPEISRISKSYLCHSEWDTRIAAAESIEAIIDQVCTILYGFKRSDRRYDPLITESYSLN